MPPTPRYFTNRSQWRAWLFSESYQRIRVAYIDNAREHPEFFEKRLNYFLKNTKMNKMIKGYGGIEKYY